jgi:hypothetical protein
VARMSDAPTRFPSASDGARSEFAALFREPVEGQKSRQRRRRPGGLDGPLRRGQPVEGQPEAPTAR